MISGDTIAAVSSATAPAARMIVRLSGPRARDIAAQLWTTTLPEHAGAIRGVINLHDMPVPAWCYLFAGPRSYTGEDTIEFHLPGNPLLAKMLLKELLRGGARSAEPGEFTARAWFNGRLNLTEAEGVAATIAAGTEQELAAARRLLSGELARRVAPAIDLLANTLALLEVGIDFSDEDVTFLEAPQVAQRIAAVDEMLATLLAESSRFERLAHEPTAVLVGRPNAGKSTLLNALAGRERAVVSPVAGTTRDILSAEAPLARGLIRLIDVAGIEAAELPAEAIAASPAIQQIEARMREHALRAVEEADYVLVVREGGDPRPPMPLPRKPDLIVITKADLHGSAAVESGPPADSPGAAGAGPSQPGPPPALSISAITGVGLSHLRDRLDRLCFGDSSSTSSLAINARHVTAIEEARAALRTAGEQLASGPEFVALDLRMALDALGGITGRISPDDVLGRIFSGFCIGK